MRYVRENGHYTCKKTFKKLGVGADIQYEAYLRPLRVMCYGQWCRRARNFRSTRLRIFIKKIQKTTILCCR